MNRATEPDGVLHNLLIRRGPEFLVALGVVLAGLGVGLDRDWLVGFGLVAVMLGVVLPRVRGTLEAGPAGIKVAEIIDPSELRALTRAKARDLPTAAVQRLEDEADLAAANLNRYVLAGPLDAPEYVPPELTPPQLAELLAEGIVSRARREWRVTFIGPLSDDARKAIDAADDVVLISGHSLPGIESHSVIVNAATANEAVNRVRNVLAGHGHFGQWEAKPFEPPFGFFDNPEEPNGSDDPPDETPNRIRERSYSLIRRRAASSSSASSGSTGLRRYDPGARLGERAAS